jgi:hypothetical protein
MMHVLPTGFLIALTTQGSFDAELAGSLVSLSSPLATEIGLAPQ